MKNYAIKNLELSKSLKDMLNFTSLGQKIFYERDEQ